MKRILVTGGTGVLGREIVGALSHNATEVITLTHRQGTSHRYGDLLSDDGLEAAFAGVEVVVHAATSTKALEDIQMTQHLVAAARKAAVKHIVYVSIAGIDDLDYDYYRAKVAGERLVMQSGIPHTIQRATQFFEFVVNLLDMLKVGPVQVAPTHTQLQPVEVGAVGQAFAALALGEPLGRIATDLAGPNILTLEQMARDWTAARWVVPAPIPHPGLKAMRTGNVIPAQARTIGPTWKDWVDGQTTRMNPYSGQRS